MAQQYYKKPTSMEGGDKNFYNSRIPSQLVITSNGSYGIRDYGPQMIIIEGVGNVIGDNGTSRVTVKVKITSDTAEISIIN